MSLKFLINNPCGIALNSRNEIIVSELNNNRIQIFDYEGNHIKFVGIGNLSSPTQVCVDGMDNIYVGSWDKKKGVTIFSSETGQLIREINEPFIKIPFGVVFDPKGDRLYITNNDLHTVCVF